jgi:beta-galactosidase
MTDELRDAGPTRLTSRGIEIDGEPRVVLAGEIHYFRLDRSDWAGRIAEAKAAGLNTVASYIPWIWHELPDGSFDVTGRTSPERDLGAFIDLCGEAGLWFIARPGPFQMAELKNEGLPYRLRREHPEIHPVGWNGEPTTTRGVDYLAPAFLEESRRWYDAVMPVVVSRQRERGGPVIAVQLDNEVGMLDWVANAPTLTDKAIAEFADWAATDADPSSRAVLADVAELPRLAALLRSGGTSAGVELPVHNAFARFTRNRFATYLQTLEGWARELGATAPLLVNIHGTGGGRGLTYPIGVSQLAPSYRERPGVTGGTDMYLGELTVTNVADLYLGNAFTAAVQADDQPLGALEFDAGDGDYGEDLHNLTSAQATVLKSVLTVAQGARFINYYLFTGGINPLLEEPVGDGNDRIAFTGERHGFAAPIGPEGERNPAFDGVVDATASILAHQDVLASGRQLTDDLVLGFVADHYLTEYAHPDAAERREQVAGRERHRGFGERQILSRALVLGGYSFGALDLQAAAGGDPDWSRGAETDAREGAERELIVIATGCELGRAVQDFLARHVTSGGRLLLVGELPSIDADGSACTVLADTLGLASAGRVRETIDANSAYQPSVRAVGPLSAHGSREVRVGGAQLIDTSGATDAVELLRETGSGLPAAVAVAIPPLEGDKSGTAVVLGADYPAHLGFWHDLIALAGVRPRLDLGTDRPGVVAVPVRDTTSSRGVLVVVNVAPYAVRFAPTLDGVALTDGPVVLGERGHLILTIPPRTENE